MKQYALYTIITEKKHAKGSDIDYEKIYTVICCVGTDSMDNELEDKSRGGVRDQRAGCFFNAYGWTQPKFIQTDVEWTNMAT